MKRSLQFIVVLSLFVLISSCQKDDVKTLPTLTTKEITNIKDTSAYCGGAITNNGNDTIIARGVCWPLTSTTPDINDSIIYNRSGEREFTSYIVYFLVQLIMFELMQQIL